MWIYRYRYVEFLTSGACHGISIGISIFRGWRSFRYDFFLYLSHNDKILIIKHVYIVWNISGPKKMREKGTFTVGIKFKLENIYKILQTILM